MTDLRDQLADFEAAARRLLEPHRPLVLVHNRPAKCHPGRPHKARGLCPGCYEHHTNAGTLHQHPRNHRTMAEFVAAYTALRGEGHSARYVAYRLGITFDGLNKAYYRAVRAGALTPDRSAA